MDMKVNSELIRKLRSDASWSQEELAAASGLSLRTVQRVESDGVAAMETLKALATAFQLNSKDLELADSVVEAHKEKIATGILLTWVGSAWLLNLGWGVGLLGIGAIFIGSQVWRAKVDKLPPLWDWAAFGLLFLLGGMAALLGMDIRIAPGIVLITGCWVLLMERKKHQR